MFIYDISRGSEKWRYLAELKPLLLFGLAIWDQIRKGTNQYKADRVTLIDGLQHRFPNADLGDIMNYVNSLGQEEQIALRKLYEQDLKTVAISSHPFSGKIGQTKKELLSFDDIVSDKESHG
ncbi:MAG: hypothetical protein HY527_08600 [Betaproteobacteria bacterium]|nr:hypothetical protein [Betaproteobacteria bacterium]